MSEATQSREQVIDLPDGSLRLVSVTQGRLVLGELLQGTATRNDILTAMGEFGAIEGHLGGNIDTLADGVIGEIPVAVTRRINLPMQTTSELFALPLLDEVIAPGQLEKLDQLDVMFPVNAGDTLITVDSPRKTVVMCPDGQTEIVKIHHNTGPEIFCGANTAANNQGNSVVASIDGFAHRTPFGTVSVYPAERIRAIGGIHSRVVKESAIIVDLDVDTASQIKTPSTLIVEGTVYGAQIEAGGNVHINLDARVHEHSSESIIIAGQSVRARTFFDTNIQAGSYVIATQELSNCQVNCMETVVTPKINASRIVVGSRLVAGEIGGNTQIQFGAKMDPYTDLEKRQGNYMEHARRLSDFEENLNQAVYQWKKTRENLAQIISMIRRPSFPQEQRPKAQQAINQLYDELEALLRTSRENFEHFKVEGQRLARERIELDYYQHRMERPRDPYILVLGSIEAGTKIKGPSDEMTLQETLSRVRFGLERYTGALIQTSLPD